MNYGNSCAWAKPWIGNCNYSAAYETLEHIYGKLKVIAYDFHVANISSVILASSSHGK